MAEEMNSLKIKDFLEIEELYHFFDFKTRDGIKYWDIVRYNIYDYITSGNEELLPKKIKRPFFIFIEFGFQLMLFLSKILVCRPKYLCFTCSRNKNKDGKKIDIISQDIVSRLSPNERLLIDSFSNEKNQFSCICNNGLFFVNYLVKFKKWFKKFKTEKHYEALEILTNKLNISPGEKDVLVYILNNELNRYRIEKEYYKKLFLVLCPKIIFIVQNGIQKGMMSAANSLRIPLVELQHGYIGRQHIAYSYPPSITRGQIQNLPDYFFAFSPFWVKNINFPIKSIKFIGNSYYSKKLIKAKKYNIIFVMGGFDSIFFSLVEDMLKMNSEEKICIKLHPAQYSKYNQYLKQYKVFSNVDVIANELTIPELLSQTESIVAIGSTCVYEALHNNTKIFLIKIPNYPLFDDIYDNPLVTLIDSAEDIIKAQNNVLPEQDNKVVYFEDFNETLFNNFLSEFAP